MFSLKNTCKYQLPISLVMIPASDIMDSLLFWISRLSDV